MYLSAFLILVETGSTYRATQVIVWTSLLWALSAHIVLGGYFWSGGFFLYGISIAAVSAMWLDKKTTYVVIGLWSTLGIVLAFLEPTLRSTRQAPALTFDCW